MRVTIALAMACSFLSIKPASTSSSGCVRSEKCGTRLLTLRRRNRLRPSATNYGSGDGGTWPSQMCQSGSTIIMPDLAGSNGCMAITVRESFGLMNGIRSRDGRYVLQAVA